MQSMLKTLILLSFCAGAVLYLCPEGGAKRMLRLLCTAALMSAVLAPLRDIDYDFLTLEQARMEGAQAEIAHRAADTQASLKKLLVRENCETYIQNQGQALGLAIQSVSAELRQGEDGEWLPYAAAIHAAGDETAAESLRRELAQTLGIPTERQVWVLNE